MYILDEQWSGQSPILDGGAVYILDEQWFGSQPILDGAGATTSGRLCGFEMVDLEPTWKRALRKREEKVRKVSLDRKKRKRAELIEKLAAKEALSTKPDAQIGERLTSLLDEWIELAPKLDTKPVDEVSPEDAQQAFMARVAEHIRRLEDEDDEQAVEMLLLM